MNYRKTELGLKAKRLFVGGQLDGQFSHTASDFYDGYILCPITCAPLNLTVWVFRHESTRLVDAIIRTYDHLRQQIVATWGNSPDYA
jgi:hypothetical protein